MKAIVYRIQNVPKKNFGLDNFELFNNVFYHKASQYSIDRFTWTLALKCIIHVFDFILLD